MGCPPPNLIHQLQTILDYHTPISLWIAGFNTNWVITLNT